MKFSPVQQKIVDYVQDHPDESSAVIAKKIDIGSGRLYPALHALEADGVLTSEWVDGPYPRRRIYRVRSNSYFSADFSPKDFHPVARR